MRGMRMALYEPRDLCNALATLPADPWAGEVRATLEARWAQLDELSVQLRGYVDTQSVALTNAIAARAPTLVGGPCTIHARDTAARVAEHYARTTGGAVPRATTAGHNKMPTSDRRSAGVLGRWADEPADTPGLASTDPLPCPAMQLDTPLAPKLGPRQPTPTRAPPSPVTSFKAAQPGVTVLPVKAPPAPRVPSVASLPMTTPLIPTVPQQPVTWLAPQDLSRNGQAPQRGAMGADAPPRPPAPWGSTSATALPRDGGAFHWADGRPSGWNIVMGDSCHHGSRPCTRAP